MELKKKTTTLSDEVKVSCISGGSGGSSGSTCICAGSVAVSIGYSGEQEIWEEVGM